MIVSIYALTKTKDLYSQSLFGQMEMVLKRKEFTQI